MEKPHSINDQDTEIIALSQVYLALKDLDQAAQHRVLDYVAKKLGLSHSIAITPSNKTPESDTSQISNPPKKDDEKGDETSDDIVDGVSPVAQKWIRRNSISPENLSAIFSLGIDEIDLVAKAIPGKNKKEKMLNVFLLTGVSAYLSSGTPRFTHEKVREACLHYDAFDQSNFAANFKGFSADVAGGKDTGYSLTARGLANATDLIKQMVDGSR